MRIGSEAPKRRRLAVFAASRRHRRLHLGDHIGKAGRLQHGLGGERGAGPAWCVHRVENAGTREQDREADAATDANSVTRRVESLFE
jgi:hypothetical protein